MRSKIDIAFEKVAGFGRELAGEIVGRIPSTIIDHPVPTGIATLGGAGIGYGTSDEDASTKEKVVRSLAGGGAGLMAPALARAGSALGLVAAPATLHMKKLEKHMKKLEKEVDHIPEEAWAERVEAGEKINEQFNKIYRVAEVADPLLAGAVPLGLGIGGGISVYKREKGEK